MNGKIYIVKNSVNNKCYIGQTKQPILLRWKDHTGVKKTTGLLYKAIKKYGKQNFTIQCLVENIKTQKELDFLEIDYIAKYNTISPNGYNLTSGGFGGNGIRSIPVEKHINIVSDYIAGKSTGELAKEYNVSVGTVNRILKENNLECRDNRECQQILLDIKLPEVLELYLNHNSTTIVGKFLNVSESSVRRFLQKHKIPLTGRGKHQLGKKRKKVVDKEQSQ